MAKLGYTQLEFMTLEMASLARANIPLPEGLRQLSLAARSARMRSAYEGLATALDRGVPLSEALAGISAPAEFIAAIRCAEVSGSMADVLEYAVEHCRRVDRFYGALANAVLYPILVLAIALPILTLLGMVVLPKFEDIFFQLGGDLPAPTQVIMGISHLLHRGGGIVLLVFSFFVLVWCCSPFFIRGLPVLLRSLPLFNKAIMLSDMTMLMRFLERMLRRNIPLPTVLRAASLAVWGGPLRARLKAMADHAEKGHPVFGMLRNAVPALPVHLLQQAEQRGDLATTCAGIASYCEDRFNARTQSQIQRFEPIAILFLGFMIGWVIIALYLPLFNIPKLIR